MNKNPIEKLIKAAKIIVGTHSLDDYLALSSAIAAAETYLSAIQSDLPKPLPTRERMIDIINSCIVNSTTKEYLADAILHDGQIKIGDGWVDPKSGTTTYYVTRDFRAINEDTAFNRSFNSYPNNHYFLEKPHAEAFRAAELAKMHKDMIEIGNGKWVKNNAIGLYWARSDSSLPTAVAKTITGIGTRFWDRLRDRVFLTESEAEDQLRKDGFVKIGGGEWVKSGTKHWYVSTDCDFTTKTTVFPTNIHTDRHFTDPIKAAEFLKAELDKETK